MANVVIKRQVAAHNIDAYNRVAKVETQDVENGSVMQLLTRSEVDGENEVWIGTAPVASVPGLWMAKSSEVGITSVTNGTDTLAFKGIVEDPRFFTNVKGGMIDVFKPVVNDIIEMTLGDDAKDYLVPTAGSFALTPADQSATADSGFVMKKVGTGILHIGQAGFVKTPVKTYIYEVMAN